MAAQQHRLLNIKMISCDVEILLKKQLTTIFSAYQRGVDVSPGQRYRYEGVVLAAVEVCGLSLADIDGLQRQIYLEVFGSTASYCCEPGSVSAMMKPAPVMPTSVN